MSNISFESLFDRKASLRSNTAEEDLAKLGKMLMNKKKKSMGLVPRKRYQAPKRDIQRDAMGAYIVPSDGQPLTRLCGNLPGPGTYDTPDLNLTHECAPQYSIAGGNKKKRVINTAGPADYNAGQDLAWNKCRGFTIKARIAKSDETCTPGPACYLPRGVCTGESGPKYSMGLKDAVGGLQQLSLLQPPDVKGFETPAPDYLPDPEQKSGFSFGLLPKTKPEDKRPGPATYLPPSPRKGPAWSMTFKQKSPNSDEGPGPNSYDVKSALGTGPGVSMSGSHDLRLYNEGASPTSYYVKLPVHKIGVTMKYRAFETTVEGTPGPAAYMVDPVPRVCPRKKDLKATTFTCREHCCPTFPGSPTRVRKSKRSGRMPGPANYSLLKDFEKNDSPAYTFGHRALAKTPDDAQANLYNGKNLDTGPAFSMGSKIPDPIAPEIPGPAKYYPKQRKRPGWTMAGKAKPKKADVNVPAPNAYSLDNGHCKYVGSTLRSRHSPWVYSGIPTTKVLDAGGDQQRARLLQESG